MTSPRCQSDTRALTRAGLARLRSAAAGNASASPIIQLGTSIASSRAAYRVDRERNARLMRVRQLFEDKDHDLFIGSNKESGSIHRSGVKFPKAALSN
ncbi:hypothetical protein D9M71_638890 [compost metagenome]